MRGRIQILSILAGLALATGCDDNGGTDAGGGGTDAGPGGTDAGPGTDGGGGGMGTCDSYCDVITANCSGDNAIYLDRAQCVAFCNDIAWPQGDVGDMDGNTLECRIYHAGVAADDPVFHCPHAGPTGREVCGTVDFRTDAPTAFTRVDRMGMPAVATALIGSAMKDAYNDADPSDDAAGTFVPELAASNTALHTALDDDLGGLSLSPCSMTEMVGPLPAPGGPTVASLVVPDVLTINPANAPGFPNGRQLADPVIDVTLAIILLEMGATCGAGLCSPTTLHGVPVPPPAAHALTIDGAPSRLVPRRRAFQFS
jgi:hypothetical protein